MSKKKRYKLRNSMIENEDGRIIATVVDGTSEEDINNLLRAPQALGAIEEFVDGVNSGTLKPRSAVKEFEKVLEND